MSDNPKIGVIGLGSMGMHYARNLIEKEYSTCGFDLVTEKLEEVDRLGGQPCTNIPDLISRCEIILTSLPSSSAFLSTAEQEILPNILPGQIVIETGTTVSVDLVELSEKFAEKGASLVDCPVSGGPWGAEKAELKMFFGGESRILDTVRPVLLAIGGEDTLYHCGLAGSGQAMKAVNQLKMAFETAVYLEILAYAQKSGLDLSLIQEIWDGQLQTIAGFILQDRGTELGVKFRELPYFIRDAAERGFALPLTNRLHEFCEQGEFKFFDDHRKAPSFWHELTKGSKISTQTL